MVKRGKLVKIANLFNLSKESSEEKPLFCCGIHFFSFIVYFQTQAFNVAL